MAIDYSKWDKLELSDDSDIEVHPNVDKKSFIRWRQRDIHEKRAMRKQKMEDIKSAVSMNQRLKDRIAQMYTYLQEYSPSEPLTYLSSFLQSKSQEDSEQAVEGGMSYHQMLVALLDTIKKAIEEENNSSLGINEQYIKHLQSHEKRLDDLMMKAKEEYDELESESKKYITSEDLHIGFDSTHVQKKEEESKNKKKEKESVQVIESLNDPSPSTHQQEVGSAQSSSAITKAEQEESDSDSVSLSVDGTKFSQIAFGDYAASESFLKEHLHLLAEESESDSILLEAFNAELEGKPWLAKQFVHQALLLNYCRQLGPGGITIFFQRVQDPNHQARRLFLEDVQSTYNRIHERSHAMANEQAQNGEGVEQIQLCAVDANTKLSIIIPEKDATEPEVKAARVTFESFPPNLQKALESNNLDKINAVLGKMPIEDAEEVVEKLSSTGMLSIEEGIIDTTKGETIPEPSAQQ
ncbi:hsp90-like protein [Schizosaccharomyces cryophilus OY26]|uniref:Hsp90 chaperone protein kinase-targeting subunit n=1 Tax=Schizosaccharomyces cryophilus (strain OY26 / ATCC MYA-4695 / CBS 11777 / NBRC 106824 / NRRL Y48691) TaxID=653667 RepID=S9XGX1_SCHCR|nr:hsp90-like protein [Schizosaccharomyces cryophilus OY26]EPY52916.1 hsp90-like protein [Schizosaccharomyces cryophilus OY26]